MYTVLTEVTAGIIPVFKYSLTSTWFVCKSSYHDNDSVKANCRALL